MCIHISVVNTIDISTVENLYQFTSYWYDFYFVLLKQIDEGRERIIKRQADDQRKNGTWLAA